MKKLSIIIFPLFLVSVAGYCQQSEFEFDEVIVHKYAMIGMEEYNRHNSNHKRDFKKDYLVDKSSNFGKYILDCNGNQVKVILVLFPEAQRTSTAYVYLTYSKDNYFESIINRGYTNENIVNYLDKFKSKKSDDNEIFGCEIY